jgi:hypothetical protein
MTQEPSSAAIGWSVFAATVLMMMGVFQMLVGLAAVVKQEFFVVGDEYLFEFDVSAWGWIHLLVGLVVLLSGIGIYSGNVLARTVGVLIAAGSAVTSFLWLPYQPVWSSVLIAMAVAVIWALSVHGRDIVLADQHR